ncbi:MAG: fluoride efflux transporter CrcB [Rhodospirillales bacterium]|nr:MAG: fluoride efflux transporter CrcB [Rhodospirillales bacterium]
MTAWLPGILLVAIGGAVGGMARFWLSGVVARNYGETFPWGTMAVNVSGAAGIGVLAALLLADGTHAVEDAPRWALLAIGMLGSYTTVSSFSLQTLALLRDGEPQRAALNVAGSLVLCLGAAGAGYAAVLAIAGG